MIDHNPVWRTRQVANNFADTRLLLRAIAVVKFKQCREQIVGFTTRLSQSGISRSQKL
jgi:ribosomal protein S17E